jgi:hypothetical protein
VACVKPSATQALLPRLPFSVLVPYRSLPMLSVALRMEACHTIQSLSSLVLLVHCSA